MKNLLKLLSFLCFVTACNNNNFNETEQKKISSPANKTLTSIEVVPLDKSPLDCVYYPIDYTKHKLTKKITSNPDIRILYSRPQKYGREIFGVLIPYNKPWRLGANESTEIEFFRDAIIAGKKLTKGKYIMYCIPGVDSWTICFNTNINSWGLDIDSTKDVLCTSIDIEKLSQPVEHFAIYFDENYKSPLLHFTWDNVDCKLPITLL